MHGDVKRRRGLICDQDIGLGRQRNRNHDALLLSARKLEGVIVESTRGLGDAHPRHPEHGTLASLPPPE